MSDKLKYELRGVSASKSEVHAAIKNLDKGLFPTAFCKILPDIMAMDPAYVNIMHADTAGTKTSLAYMYWKETNDLDVWKGIVQDAIVMNVDDMACVGCFDQIVLSSTVGRNKNLIDGDVIKTIILAAVSFKEKMANYGINLHLAGGETADVGDIVRSLDVGFTTFARLKKEDLIVNNIKAGQVIIGLASYGQSNYEEKYNSGIGSNGLTSARHDVLDKSHLTKFRDSYDHNTPEEVLYTGSKKLTDTIEIDGKNYKVGDLLLSPTRTYLPVFKKIIPLFKENIHGIIHCTGGAQTKVLKFVKGVHIVKDNLLPIPPVFKMIQAESQTNLKEMYQVFNMGHRMEMYVDPSAAPGILEEVAKFGIDAQIIGKVEASSDTRLTITHGDQVFEYIPE